MSRHDGYHSRLMAAEEALRCVDVRNARLHSARMRRTGNTRRSADGAGAFCSRRGNRPPANSGTAPITLRPEMAGHFRHNAMFIGGNVRDAVNEGRADYTPVYLSEIEELFESGAMPIDVALIQVSPPDAHGFCSFGVGVDTTMTAANVRALRGCASQ